MKAYQPQWLRLAEAKSALMTTLSLSERESEAWLLRAIQDQLRADAEGYAAQTMFRAQGFPTRWERRRFPRDWPARLTPDRIDWEASTINGPHPERLIQADIFIEVRSEALSPDAKNHVEKPRGFHTNREAALKATCIDWLRTLPELPVMRRDDIKEQALSEIPGLSGHQFKAAWDEAAPASWKRAGRKTTA